MTQLQRFDTSALNKALVGFDRIFDDMERKFANQMTTNYPPYNVLKKSDDEYAIEMAVTGFEKDEITVETEMDTLTVKGCKLDISEGTDAPQYLHRGLAQRDFTRSFTLAEHMEVKSAEVKNGILTVSIKRNIPEYAKPKLIEVVEVK